MRVYQFRHIRAEGQFSLSWGIRTDAARTYHAALLRRSSLPPRARPHCGLRAAGGGIGGRLAPFRRQARRGRRHAAAALARGRGSAQPDAPGRGAPEPLGFRAHARGCLLSPHVRGGTAHARGTAGGVDPRGPRQLALRRRARRRLGRPPRLRPRAPALDPGRDRLAERHLPRAPRRARSRRGGRGGSRPVPDRCHGALGTEARHRRAGHQDRHHRRRHRPGASLLQAVGLLVSGRLPEGEHRVHHAEGHRRARVPVAVDALEVRRPAVRSAVSVPRDPRRGDRGRRLRHADRSQGRLPHLGRRAEGIPRQLQGADRADGGLRARRQFAGARQGDRPGGGRRDERHQLLDRRARGGAAPRHRRPGARQRRGRRRRAGRLRRQRLRHRRARDDRLPRQRPRPRSRSPPRPWGNGDGTRPRPHR